MVDRRFRWLGVAAVIALTAGASGGPAQAQYYPAGYGYGYRGYGGYGYGVGPADPCAREAANRRLGWGLFGAIVGGFAGSAVAAAGVAAEGAAVGAVVGGLTGGFFGGRSAACGTAAYTGMPVAGVTPSGVAVYGAPVASYGYPVYTYGYPPPGYVVYRTEYSDYHSGAVVPSGAYYNQ
jgi:hypothetical protein